MFSGIVQSVGRISAVLEREGGKEMTILPNLERQWREGESVLVSGICTTVARAEQGALQCFYMPETLAKTTAASWKEGGRVNIEPSLKMGDELSGNFVFGHVDGKAEVAGVETQGASRVLTFRIPPDFSKYFVSKGTAAVDGVSLTVLNPAKDTFQASLIPYTLEHTALGDLKEGDEVNVEIDMLAKYVARILERD